MVHAEISAPVLERVEQALELCRPYLWADGGDVELIGIKEDGIVELMFHGTCNNCPMSRMTLRAGLERAILKAAPEVRRVESIVSDSFSKLQATGTQHLSQ